MNRLRLATLVVALLAAAVTIPSANAAEPPADAPALTGPARTVTLITGDRVTVAGDRVTGVRMADSRRGLRHLRYLVRGHEHVVPEDAVPLLAKGVLDSRLFDITTLLDQRYDDASQATIPTIVRMDPGRSAPVPGTRALGLDMTSVSTPKAKAATAWQDLLSAGGVRKIWLNGRVRANLDQSVPQIGAPEAWRAGLRADDVKVAVLDSGYDATHPDLMSTVDAEQDFTFEGNPRNDDIGHGTHVASTIAGRGTASGGRYTGVAPGARLLVGRVLAGGVGQEDWVIAGMHWAVEQGAKVINMSLGAGPTDGTDPLSQAVNELSESSGALFVVSAGNSGAPGTVGAPGTADRALTVGSVTKSDRLSVFSSRGPRVGDYGLKPEITAPGSDIVAARAAGTLPDVSVNEHYARLSGTSMAAPHVAGAAAILAGQHPDWTGERLKGALVSSAKRLPDVDTHAQGAGRVDVGRAVRQQVRAEGTAGFGLVWTEPGTSTVRRQVSYVNDGDRPVRLRLDLDVGSKQFSVDKEWLTVPARSSASVTVTANLTDKPGGELSGVLKASGHDVTLTTPLSAHLAGSKHSVTVRPLPKSGEVDVAQVILQNEETGWSDVRFVFGEPAQFTVAAGRYRVIGWIRDTAGNSTMFAQPARIDTELVVDAKQGKEVSASIDDRDALWEYDGGHILQSDVDESGPGRMESVGWGGPATGSRFRLGTIAGPPLRGLRLTHFSHWAHPRVTADALGEGGFGFRTLYAPWPVSIPGPVTARLVDVGEADQGSIDRAGDLAGAIVMIRPADWSDPVHPPGEQLRSGLELLKRKGVVAVLSAFYPNIDIAGPYVPVLPTAVVLDEQYLRRAYDLIQQRPVELTMNSRPNSPVAYFLSATLTGSLPAGPRFDFRRAELGRVERELVDTMPANTYRFQEASWAGAGIAVSTLVETMWPQRRTDYVSPGSPFWLRSASGFTDTVDFGVETTTPVSLRTGEARRSRVLGAPFGPELAQPPISAQDGKPIPWAYRQGDKLTVAIPMFADSDAGSTGAFDTTNHGSTVLFKDGKEIARRADRPGLGTFDLPRGPGRYTLIADADRPAAGALEPALGIRSKAEWTFRTDRGTDGREALPFLDIRFDLPLDDHNRARTGELTGQVFVAHQPNARPLPIRSLTVDVSYDDGKRWQRAVAQRAGDGWRVRIPGGGAPGGYASLLATAVDMNGNSVTETMIRGYAVR